MMKSSLALVIAVSSIQAYSEEESIFSVCASETNDSKRLICYDEFAEEAMNKSEESVAKIESTVTEASASRPQKDTNLSQTKQTNLWSLEKMAADDPNFFGVSWDPSSDNRGVRDHIEFDISLKYPLWELSDEKRVLFIYNGGYDFQEITDDKIYNSSPVISTKQNPGLAFEWDSENGEKKFRIGVFHHSNGQTLTEYTGDEEFTNEGKYLWDDINSLEEIRQIRDDWGEAPAVERISRSSWYTQFRYQRTSNSSNILGNDWWQYQLEVRPWYFKNDDRIFWEPVSSENPQIEKFDGIRVVGEKMFTTDEIPIVKNFQLDAPVRLLGRIELQTGVWSPLANIGGKFSLGINVNSFILSGYYYSGYAKDIAFYHKRTKHMGVGIELR